MATSILGFECSEEQAHAVEALVKAQPSGAEYEYRRVIVKTDVDRFEEGERADVSVVGSSAVDREGEVVLPNGLDLSQFRNNPVVTFNHDYKISPIGRCAWIKYEPRRDALLAKTIYARRPDGWQGDWLPDAVYSLVQQRVLQGKSVGFLPREIRPPSDVERKSAGWSNVSRVITKGVLLEYAVAGLPCNPDALVEAVAKSYVTKSACTLLNLDVPEPTFDATKYIGKTWTPPILTAQQAASTAESTLRAKLATIDWDAIARDAVDYARGRI